MSRGMVWPRRAGAECDRPSFRGLGMVWARSSHEPGDALGFVSRFGDCGMAWARLSGLTEPVHVCARGMTWARPTLR